MKGKKMGAREELALLESSSVYRRRVFKDLIAHIVKGMSIQCFSTMGEQMIFNYMTRFPEDFIASDLDKAMRDGQEGWENIGRRQAEGSCIGNSRSWFYNMAHRYKWSDRVDVTTEHKGEVKVNIVNYGSPSTLDSTVEA